MARKVIKILRDKSGRFTKVKSKCKIIPTFNIGDLVFIKSSLVSNFTETLKELGIPGIIEGKQGIHYYRVNLGKLAGSNRFKYITVTKRFLEKASINRKNLGDFMDWDNAAIQRLEDFDGNPTKDYCIRIGCNQFLKEDFKGFNAVMRTIIYRTGGLENLTLDAIKQAMSISFKAELIVK